MYIKWFILITKYLFRHYPTPKSTAVADNPEMQRIRQLQDVQSNVFTILDWNFVNEICFSRRNIIKILMKIKENLLL